MENKFIIDMFSEFEQVKNEETFEFHNKQNFNFRNFLKNRKFEEKNNLSEFLSLLPEELIVSHVLVLNEHNEEYTLKFQFRENSFMKKNCYLEISNIQLRFLLCKFDKIIRIEGILNIFDVKIEVKVTCCHLLEIQLIKKTKEIKMTSLDQIFDLFSLKSKKFPKFLSNFSKKQKSKNFIFQIINLSGIMNLEGKFELKSIQFKFKKPYSPDELFPSLISFDFSIFEIIQITTFSKLEITTKFDSIQVLSKGDSKLLFLNSVETFNGFPTEFFYNFKFKNIFYSSEINEEIEVKKTNIIEIPIQKLTSKISFSYFKRKFFFHLNFTNWFSEHVTVQFNTGELKSGSFYDDNNDLTKFLKSYNLILLENVGIFLIENISIDSFYLIFDGYFSKDLENFMRIKIPFVMYERAKFITKSNRFSYSNTKVNINESKSFDIFFKFKHEI